ncbi:MAG: cupin domain-containing protein [Trueperaceae bacterium]|nr:cupin domain-containing protein [Trueperaceae bacterium]
MSTDRDEAAGGDARNARGPDEHEPDRARKVRLDELPSATPRQGVTRRRLLGQRIELIAYRYEPGTVFPRHAHAAEQMTIVQSGVLVFAFDEGEMRLEAGEAVTIPGGVPHGAHVPEDAAGPTETLNVFTPVREAPPG